MLPRADPWMARPQPTRVTLQGKVAFCSASTVRQGDGLVNSVIWHDEIPDLQNLPPLPKEIKSDALIYPYKEDFEWNYFSWMTKDELLCITLHDSARTWRTPHCSEFFNDEEGTYPRESIEVRACCYFS